QPYPFPTLHLRPAPSIFEYVYDDVEVRDYQHHPAIKAPVAI
ncbi:MAG TPA: thymidylate synthase, partial [Pengzhenrongella sp.]